MQQVSFADMPYFSSPGHILLYSLLHINLQFNNQLMQTIPYHAMYLYHDTIEVIY